MKDRLPDYRPIRRKGGALCPGLFRKLAAAKARRDADQRAADKQPLPKPAAADRESVATIRQQTTT